MGGKKEKEAQRTKGSTKPSSSARSARILASSGGFVGFSAVSAELASSGSGNVLPGAAFVPLSGITSADDPDTSSEGQHQLPGELRLVLRKMGKRDAVTKLKVSEASE